MKTWEADTRDEYSTPSLLAFPFFMMKLTSRMSCSQQSCSLARWSASTSSQISRASSIIASALITKSKFCLAHSFDTSAGLSRLALPSLTFSMGEFICASSAATRILTGCETAFGQFSVASFSMNVPPTWPCTTLVPRGAFGSGG